MSAAGVSHFAIWELVGLAQVDAEAKAHGYPDCLVVEFDSACR